METADAGSFTKAARRLGLSASAVSKSVMRLEERLKTRLFHRSTRSLTLTSEGSLFLERCRRIVAEMDAAENDLAHANELPQGRLRFSMPSAGMPFLPKLAQFQKQYPEIELEIVCTDRAVDVIDEGYDVAFQSGGVTDSRLMSRVIGVYRQMVVGSADYLRRRGVPQLPADLQHHSCIVYRSHRDGKILPWPLMADGEVFDVSVVASTITDLLEPQLVFAREGAGFACVPDIAVMDDIKAGTLIPVLSQYADGPVTFSAIWPSSRHLNPKIRVFIDFVVSEFFPKPMAGDGIVAAYGR